MEYPKQYREDELEKIVCEAQMYLCACPSQVAAELLRLRELIDYQHTCEREVTDAAITHQAIAHAALQAHALMEDCLTQVLKIEGWDRQTLKMPEGLRKHRDDFLNRPFSHDGTEAGPSG